MTKQDIRIVQESMQDVLLAAQATGERLYAHLFEIEPFLQHLFKADIPTQSRKLMSILIHITAHLDQMERLQTELQELAFKHEGYQVKAEHYDLLRLALFRSLSETLAEKWTDEVEQAWGYAYDLIATSMIEMQKTAR